MCTCSNQPNPQAAQAQLQALQLPQLPQLQLPQLPQLGPALIALLPNSGPVDGGNTVTLFGLGLAGTTDVQFGEESATITGQDPFGLTVTVQAPPQDPGAVQVTATNAVGTTNPVTYVYVEPTDPPAPVAAAIIPNAGPAGGGIPFAIVGSGLQNADVTFGDTPAIVLGTDPGGSFLFGLVPAGPAGGGNVPVVVTTPGGSATVPGGFTYL
ncbi:hypothetical protein HEK616_77730 (plasmid) [Streptomyces nigrescens]|uniref:IPT/TIG domain-containing protein n=1 Tax=Streptomyces nigrescens TaxID=1920 RepID=A0ABM8A6F2_STRNI|nr:IPT/TIG domain-containing protein [Streptomyces nigrescens]BDM74286.1 hypothetical protein HEK616_77730 [Streptomyces nigrescens]